MADLFGGGAIGFDDSLTQQDTPIFTKRRLNPDATPQYPISHLKVANNMLYYVMSGKTPNERGFYRENLDRMDQRENLDLKFQDKIKKLLVDPTGCHVLLCTKLAQSYNTYHLSKMGKKFRVVSKLKDIPVQCVGFNRMSGSEANTGAILVGSQKGDVYMVEISGQDSSATVRHLVSINTSSEVEPVMGVEFFMQTSTNNVCVIMTSPSKIFQYNGEMASSGSLNETFINMFKQYSDGLQRPAQFEFPGEKTDCELHLFYAPQATSPSLIAWLAGPGVITVDLMSKDVLKSPDNVLKYYERIPYLADSSSEQRSPLSMVCTQFHVVQLYDPNKVIAICLLDQTIVLEEIFSGCGPVIGMCKDEMRGTQYVYSGSSIFKYSSVREDRNIWRIYLEKEQFDLAEKFAGTDNPNRLNEILLRKAEYKFSKGRYEESADFFAKTAAAFEDVALKFIEVDKSALKKYLLSKLEGLKKSDRAQITMLVMWIIHLFLTEINQADEEAILQGVVDEIREELREFLKMPKIKDCLDANRAVVYDLLGSHGDRESLIVVGELLEDFAFIVQVLVENGQYNAALDKLMAHPKPGLFYKYSSVLMQNNPVKTVESWKKQQTALMPRRFIPAIVQLEHDTKIGLQAISYLEFCIKELRNVEPPIHNCLLTLYAMYQPDKLRDFLETQTLSLRVYYDEEYALRICLKHNHVLPSIHLYKRMKLYEEAVNLALRLENNALSEAQQIARHAESECEDVAVIKQLWLHIAKYVVQQRQDVRAAMHFLHDNQYLNIEHILPFFPDFLTINEFKGAILDSLAKYNEDIEQLKNEMQFATDSAAGIRATIREIRNKYTVVSSNEKCAICNYPVLVRAFYSFPCHHSFHYDCLVEKVKQELSPAQAQRLSEIERLLSLEMQQQRAKPPDAESLTSQTTSSNAMSKESGLREDLDNMVASECLYCGEFMIKSIDRPFIPPDILHDELSSWM